MANDHDSGATPSATDALMALSRLTTAVAAYTLAEVVDALSVPQLRILVVLYDNSPLNLTTVAAELGVDRSNASRPTDKLVAAGLVRRSSDQADRRNAALSLTTKGRRLVDSVLQRRRTVFDQIVADLDPGDREQLAASVGALLGVVDRGHAGLEGLAAGSILPWIR